MENTGKNTASPTGIAIDVGTTYLHIALCNLSDGTLLKKSIRPNPQGSVSTDIIQRLVAAQNSQQEALWMQQVILCAIADTLIDLVGEKSLLEGVERLLIVGNTAMLSLLVGENYSQLLDPSSWMGRMSFELKKKGEWIRFWSLRENVSLDVVQPLGGFVGSDLLAGLAYTKIDKPGEPALFIDFGTNSEIALWDGNRFWVTSAAGGPAFEGSGISCGMAAIEGAVYSIGSEEENWSYGVIGGGEAQGICGSAMVDALALLIERGELHPNGRFAEAGRREIALFNLPFSITHNDIDILQRAKAAIAAGWETLCIEAGIGFDELRAVHVGGAFGEYINPDRAMAIGLLPILSPELVKVWGNTALKGCMELLCFAEKEAVFEAVRARSTLLNLAAVETFEEQFFRHLFLRPVHQRTHKPSPLK